VVVLSSAGSVKCGFNLRLSAIMGTYLTNDVGRIVIARLFRGIATLVLAGLFAAVLLRLAPGSSVDERELDPRLSRETITAMREERAAKREILSFYLDFLLGMTRGNPGTSDVFDRPVADLVAERFGTTVRSVLGGLLLGWVSAVLIAVVSARAMNPAPTLAAATLSGALLSVPSAVLAVVCLLLNLPPAAAIAAVVFPRVFPHAHGQFQASFEAPHVVMARARGVYGLRLFCCHVVPGTIAPLMALAGASVPLAFGTSIPVEALADSPGLGQLGWRAALGRDMPVLVTITLLLTTATVVANLISDLALVRLRVLSR
jgi:peptide/nickel transport system permease protein